MLIMHSRRGRHKQVVVVVVVLKVRMRLASVGAAVSTVEAAGFGRNSCLVGVGSLLL
jgi:hypothetical protein